MNGSLITCPLGLLVLLLSNYATVSAQDTNYLCDPVRLTTADRLYSLGLFEEVTELIETCLPNKFFEQNHREEAHRLVILSYLEIENYDAMRKWTQSLLDLNPTYRAPANDPIYFASLLNRLRPSKWHQRWLWRGVVIGAVGLGTTAFILFPNRTKPLKPLPPAPPQ